MRNFLLAAVVLLGAGCDSHPTGPSVNVRVSGRALEFATGVGVSGATVVFGKATGVTDANGSYALVVPESGRYEPSVDGIPAGQSIVTGSSYRGDLLVRPGMCVSRYGTVSDARTLKPVAGASLVIGAPGIAANAISGLDGWYRIDLGCTSIQVGFNTTIITVSHPNYVDKTQSVGRGVVGVSRLDLEL